MPASCRNAGWRRSAFCTAFGSIGTPIERVRTTVPPASRTALPTANETRPVDRADEEHRDPLALEPAGNDSRVGGIGEVLQRLLTAARRLEGLSAPRRAAAAGPRSGAFRLARSASLTNPFPESPTPTRIPITSATKTAVSEATW